MPGVVGVFEIEVRSSRWDIAWDQILADTIAQVGDTPATAAIVLKVNFGDLDAATIAGLWTMHPPSQADAADLENQAIRLAWLIRESPWPIVVAFQGAARLGGCVLALSADAVLATPGACFINPFRQTGVTSAGGLTGRLARCIGVARTLEFMVLGQPLEVERARDWGCDLVVAEPEELERAAHRAAVALTRSRSKLRAVRSHLCVGVSTQLGIA
jgi:enoyl-CoA hydratase/carnithine racemase